MREWLTPDPLQQTVNPYEFCLGNPLSYFDPDGEWAIAIPLITWTGGVLTSPLWGPLALGTIGGVALGYASYKALEWFQDNKTENDMIDEQLFQQMEAHKAKEGKQKDGIPKSNEAQNDQFKGACKEIERKLGKKLTDRQKEKLHDHVTKQGYGYHDIVEEGYWLFK